MSVFNRRANVMRAIPCVLKGPHVSAVRIAIREALEARDAGMEAFLVASPHVAFPSAKGRQDPETTIVGRGASGVWSKKQFWQRKHTAPDAGRDGGRRQMFHAAHTGLCGVLDGELSAARQALGRCRDSTWDRENESVEAPPVDVARIFPTPLTVVLNEPRICY